jgi:4a-hydroxytetrahydrobiopterin dehydratase
MARLSDDEIDERLRSSEWGRADDSIVRDFEFEDFAGAIAFVNKVADAAEAADHHPDILLHDWNNVRLTFTNHSEGGLTADDFEMAGRVDGLV